MKTKYPGITYDEKTKTYTAKNNYKEYDPIKGKILYKSRYAYRCPTLSSAREELSRLANEDMPQNGESITLEEIFEEYKRQAAARHFSETTVERTAMQLKSIYRFLPGDTKLSSVNAAAYDSLLSSLRNAGLKESTIRNYSNTLKKLFSLAYRRGYITENFFNKLYSGYLPKSPAKGNGLSERVITRNEFDRLTDCLREPGKNYRGIDVNRTYALLFTLLYVSGLRIGEALALSPADFETLALPPRQDGKVQEESGREVFQVSVRKTLVTVNGKPRVREGTKNRKDRIVPLPTSFYQMFRAYLQYREEEKHPVGERLFDMRYESVKAAFDRCLENAGIRKHTLHDFRHTYISNLVAERLPISDVAYFSGDTESVILHTYVHATEDCRYRLLEVLNR